MRTVETIRKLQLPGVDADAEAAAITQQEIEDVAGVAEIPGAIAFLAALPPGRWAIVTSASRALAASRLAAAGLPLPALMITGDDVERGKPAPDCFLLAAQRLGVPIDSCLVFEDARAGIAAAEAAGAPVLVIGATHTHPLVTAHPVVQDYAGLHCRTAASGLLELHG